MFLVNLDGQKVGKLKVLVTHYQKKRNLWLSLCECECGKTLPVYLGNLRRKAAKSCGCDRYSYLVKHRQTNCRLYRIWGNMKCRCYNPKNKDYKNYGARGIKICDEWKDFSNFYNWAMNNNYSDKLTIDRIDNNGNYEPNNCRWITNELQQNNRNDNVVITYNNITLTITQWSKFLGIPRGRLEYRLKKMNLPFSEAIKNEVYRRKIMKTGAL